MHILIIGMGRSGTTLLRRIIQMHPNVKKIFHERFLLRDFDNIQSINSYLENFNINPSKDMWGEKCPYFPSIRKISVERYCKKAYRLYSKKVRIIHIIRHPADIANSSLIKPAFRVNNINQPLQMYKRVMPRIVKNLIDMPYILNIKYEHLLLEPNVVIPNIYNFCNLKKDINFRKRLKKTQNKKYQEIDPSRAFAFLKSEQKLKVSFDEVFKVVNQIEGPIYK